jgi:hypothetical protein
VKIIINNKTFQVNLENNSTCNEFLKQLPLQLNMKDLNNNEKFIYLDKSLPANPINVNKIDVGDIMLYEDNCIVIFYKSFKTPYRYTKIGTIENPENLESNLGNGNVLVDIE